MNKEILFGKESRDKILAGVEKICNAVRVTMGGNGKTVLIGEAKYYDGFLIPMQSRLTKDGVSVARAVELQDPVENRGAMLIKEAAAKTVDQAGDATTLTCVLAEAIISGGMKLIDEGTNPQQLKKGIDSAVEYVVEELKKMSIPVRGDIERVRQIATVSANNDKYIGDLIADAFSKIGFDGVIDIEIGNTVETTIKISEGVKFDRGWVSPLFVNKPAKEACEFEEPLLLLYEKKITHHTQIERAVQMSMNLGKPLLIICEDADGEGLAFLAMNNYNKKIQCCVVKCPEIGQARIEWMEDIALLTGATYISDIRGIDIKKVNESELGKAKKVISSKNETVIIEGNGNSAALEDFINDLKMNLTQANTEEEKAAIEKRIARLTGGIAVIQVGAATETELTERLDRVDDAVRATKAAISEGFVAGGGVVFLKAMYPVLDNGKTAADNFGTPGFDFSSKLTYLINDVLSSPFKQICENAGIEVDTEMFKSISISTKNEGYNVLTGKIEDMVEAGIIDSTKALRCALINASSVAGMILTSEASIITTS